MVIKKKMEEIRILEDYLLYYHNLKIEDVEITNQPGYWKVKKGCPGGNKCRHAYRGALGPCKGGDELIIHFDEYGKRDKNGRFIDKFRVWKKLYNQTFKTDKK